MPWSPIPAGSTCLSAKWLILAIAVLSFSIPNNAVALESHLANSQVSEQRELNFETPLPTIIRDGKISKPSNNPVKAGVSLKTSMDRKKNKLYIEADPEDGYFFNAQVGEPSLKVVAPRYIDIECSSQRAEVKGLFDNENELHWIELKPNKTYATVMRSLSDFAEGKIEGSVGGGLVGTLASKLVEVRTDLSNATREENQDKELKTKVSGYYVVEIPNFACEKNPANIENFSKSWEIDFSAVEGIQMLHEPKFFAWLNFEVRDHQGRTGKFHDLDSCLVEFAEAQSIKGDYVSDVERKRIYALIGKNPEVIDARTTILKKDIGNEIGESDKEFVVLEEKDEEMPEVTEVRRTYFTFFDNNFRRIETEVRSSTTYVGKFEWEFKPVAEHGFIFATTSVLPVASENGKSVIHGDPNKLSLIRYVDGFGDRVDVIFEK